MPAELPVVSLYVMFFGDSSNLCLSKQVSKFLFATNKYNTIF